MSYKIVDGDTIVGTAEEAPVLSSLDLGSLLIGQGKVESFAIANTGLTTASYNVTVSGVNTTIMSDVELSLDNQKTWSSTNVVPSGIAANRISDTIHVRYTPSEGTITTAGTFLIRVDEV